MGDWLLHFGALTCTICAVVYVQNILRREYQPATFQTSVIFTFSRDDDIDRGSTCKQGMEQESSRWHLVPVLLAADAVALLIAGPLSFGWLSVAYLIAASATTQQSIVCKHALQSIVIETRSLLTDQLKSAAVHSAWTLDQTVQLCFAFGRV